MQQPLEECFNAVVADCVTRPPVADGRQVEVARLDLNQTHILAFDSASRIVAAWAYQLSGYFGGWRIQRDDDRMIVPPGVMVHLGRQFGHAAEMLKNGHRPRHGRAPRRTV